MSSTKTKRVYHCRTCGKRMSGPTAHQKLHGGTRKTKVKDPDAKQLDSTLIEAALDAVKAEFKDAHKDRARIAKKIRKQGEALIALAEELEG